MPTWRRRLALATAAAVAAGLPTLALFPSAQAATPTYYRPADGVLHLAGHGYGHGHGLSQWGAYGGAMSGKTYRQILAWYYANPTIATATGTMRVRITADGKGSDGLYDTQVDPAAGLTATDSAGHKLVVPAKNAAGTAYDRWRAVLLSNASLRVQGHTTSGWSDVAPTGGTATTWSGWIRFSDTSHVLRLTRPDGTHMYYRDVLEFDQLSGAVGATVNRLPLDHYAYGVVPSEMPCSWTPTVGGKKRLDALEAQAVAARTYGAWRIAHPRASSYDAVDNTSDQAYNGYSSEKLAASECPWTTSTGASTSASDAAVDATAKQIMTGSSTSTAALFAQYSASNGGWEISGGSTHLPSRPDAWDGVPKDSWSSHSWTDTITAGQLQSAYPAIGSFTDLAIDSRENLSGVDQNGNQVSEQWGGRITRLTVDGTAGSVSVTGGQFAADLGLMSSWFTVVVTKPTAPRSVTAVAGDGQAKVTWAAPSSDGGGGIRSYRITSSPALPVMTVGGSARSATITGLTNDTTYTFSVAATNTAGTGSAAAASPVTPSARTLFHHLLERRVLDTRTTGGALVAGATRSVHVVGANGVPASGVTSVLLNVVSIDSTAASSFTLWPHGASKPVDPQLSWLKGNRVNNLVWVKVGSGGNVDITNRTGSTQLLLDVAGYSTPAASGGEAMTAASPVKLFDSGPSSPVPAGATRSMTVVGRGGVPTGATAAVVQVTVAGPASADMVKLWPAGGTGNVLWSIFAPAAAWTTVTAVVPLDRTGKVDLSTQKAAHLVVDLAGWFAPSNGSTAGVTSLVTPPRRLTSTTIGAGQTTSLPVRGANGTGVPASARAVLLTLTAAGPVKGHVTVWPTGAARPAISPIQLSGPHPVTNTVLVSLGAGIGLSFYNGAGASTTVVVDVVGWCT